MARTELEQLVYQMSTDIRQLERQNKRALQNVEGTAGKIEDRYKRIAKSDPGSFLNSTFDRSRLAVFEAGAARIPVFGGALEALGPAGMVAAAGLAAVAIGATQAIEAMRFADEIDDAAAKLNIGVEALQEYRFALTEVGGETKDADEAIGSFQKKLGEALAGGKAAKWFERLGFSRDDLKSFDDTEEALGAVLDQISKLGREAERTAVSEKLGLGPMVVLAREGSERLEELRQKARDIGYVMDEELIAKGADANQKFETMSHIIGVQLKSAFVELSDEVLSFVGFVADALRGLNDFIGRFNAFKSRVDALGGRGTAGNLVTGNIGGVAASNLRGRVEAAQRGDWREAITGVGVGRDPITADDMRAFFAPNNAGPANASGELADVSGGGGRGRGRAGPSAEEIARRRAELERTVALEVARLSNNERLVRVFEREGEMARRVAQYIDLGKSAVEAKRLAAEDQARVDEARIEGQAEELRLMERQHDIEVERLLGNERYSRNMQDRLTVEREIETLTAKGYDLVSATEVAEANLLDIQRARAEVMGRIVAEAALERQLSLARIRGDEQQVLRLERAREIASRARAIESRMGLNHGEGVGQATDEVDQEIAEASRRGFREGVRGLLDDLQDGGLEGVLATIFDNVTSRLKDDLADMITDFLYQIASAREGGEGGGGWKGAVDTFLNSFGRRESGGPVTAGRAYVVGEKRAELFVPNVSGSILPSLSDVARSGGAPSRAPVIHQTLIAHMQGAVLATGLVAELKAHGVQTAMAAAGQAYAQAKSEIPAEMAYARRYSRP